MDFRFLGGVLFFVLASLFFLSLESGSEYDSVVVFRNDDVSSVGSDLKRFNDVFAENDVPVTHSVVPETIESSKNYNATCRGFRRMRGNDVRFAIHGYNHNGSEFKNSDWNSIKDKTDSIDSFSRDCLGYRPDVFVAPHNAMSSTGRILLNESGFDVISADRKMAWQTGSVTVRQNRTEFLEERPLELGQSSMMVDRWDTEPVEFENLSLLKKEFDESVERNEIHVQTLHHKPLMRNNQSGKLEDLIGYMSEEDVYFTSFDELIELFREDRIRFTGSGWKIEK